jgi:AdoMet-dependent heme synthase
MSEMKELKEHVVAGSATQTFEFFIQWHLTERCNLRCQHCYQGGRRVQELMPDEVVRQIDGATEMFQAWGREHNISVSPSIHFTGGEPFVYQGLWAVVSYARANAFGVALMSNGTAISRDDARRAFELGLSGIQISLEGPPDLHDAIRGGGSFSAAAKGIETLVGFGNRVSANVTLSRLNVHRITETAKIAQSLGCYGIGFSRIVPCGRGKGLSRHMLSPPELKEAYQTVLDLNTPAFQTLMGDPLAALLESQVPSGCSLSLSGCSAGFSGITITSDGSVMPCRRIGLSAGHLSRKPLREIWASSRLLWRLRQRESYTGKCGRCSLWPSCRGCRAVAYHHSRNMGKPDLFADDPQCWVDC